MAEWRVTPDGERQWLGGDGAWYSSERMALTAGSIRRVPSPPHDKPPPPSPTLVPKRRRRSSPVLAVLLLLIVAGGIVAVVSGRGPSATFTGSIQAVVSPTPKTLMVTVDITNTGAGMGKPSCTLFAYAPTGASGSTGFTITKTVAPGTQGFTTVYLRITTTRATRITKTEVKVTC